MTTVNNLALAALLAGAMQAGSPALAAPAGMPAAAGWSAADHVLVQYYGSRRYRSPSFGAHRMFVPRSGYREPPRPAPWARRFGPPVYRDAHGRMQIYTGKSPNKWTRTYPTRGMFPRSEVMRGGVPDLGYEHNGLWRRW